MKYLHFHITVVVKRTQQATTYIGRFDQRCFYCGLPVCLPACPPYIWSNSQKLCAVFWSFSIAMSDVMELQALLYINTFDDIQKRSLSSVSNGYLCSRLIQSGIKSTMDPYICLGPGLPFFYSLTHPILY